MVLRLTPFVLVGDLVIMPGLSYHEYLQSSWTACEHTVISMSGRTRITFLALHWNVSFPVHLTSKGST